MIQPNGVLVIVEYDTDIPNRPWVPYPLGFNALKKLLDEQGWGKATKIAEQPSLFRRANIYSAWARVG